MKDIAGIDSSKFNILLADDIPLNIILIEKMLKPFNFKITKAANGLEALQQIQAKLNTDEQIDLAIVDLMMPTMDGYEVIEHLRNGWKTDEFDFPPFNQEEFPIIILSGMNFNDDIKKGLSLGANQFLTKPVVMTQLYNAVTAELTKKVEASR